MFFDQPPRPIPSPGATHPNPQTLLEVGESPFQRQDYSLVQLSVCFIGVRTPWISKP
ncbi:hypothetical protein COCON_G00002920 [Conger conger]|uniref:Uncharacterized protein n=1 Tax=Conger conger TaxID=82655 RepID=A0A9Q1E111_CONCO|nr:hypothetical protein COCON_G00002920 [Conger conger]